MKTTKWTRRLAFLLLGVLVTVFAVAAPRVNPRKGKVFYKKYCRVCHDGNTGALEMSPMTKTMDQWTREFELGEVRSGCVDRSNEETGVELTDQDLLDIQAYLVQHAADSDQPATCGN